MLCIVCMNGAKDDQVASDYTYNMEGMMMRKMSMRTVTVYNRTVSDCLLLLLWKCGVKVGLAWDLVTNFLGDLSNLIGRLFLQRLGHSERNQDERGLISISGTPCHHATMLPWPRNQGFSSWVLLSRIGNVLYVRNTSIRPYDQYVLYVQCMGMEMVEEQ